jgi:hypothetical protein
MTDGGPFLWRFWRFAWARGDFASIAGQRHDWRRLFARLWIAWPRTFDPSSDTSR